MDRPQIENSVVTVVRTVLKCEATPETSRDNTPQWDSLKHIEIIFALEDELGIQFSEQEMAAMDSVKKIVDRAQQAHAA